MRVVLCILFIVAGFVLGTSPANATGTLKIEQTDGSSQVYKDVKLKVSEQKLWITSADGKGQLVISKAACSFVGKIMRCFPYTLTIKQNGQTEPLDFFNGTVYINPSDGNQTLPASSTVVPPNGVVFAMRSKIGTIVTLTGRLDEVTK